MGNKYNDEFTHTTCAQWATVPAISTREIVGQFRGTTGKLYPVDFPRPLVRSFQGRSVYGRPAQFYRTHGFGHCIATGIYYGFIWLRYW
jgi:hypothetical protein